MFAPKKTIPKVLGLIALTGCSGTNGLPGSGNPALLSAVRAFCMKAVACGKDVVGTDDPDSVEYCTEYLDYYYGTTSDECQTATISYFACVGEQEGCDDSQWSQACDDGSGYQACSGD